MVVRLRITSSFYGWAGMHAPRTVPSVSSTSAFLLIKPCLSDSFCYQRKDCVRLNQFARHESQSGTEKPDNAVSTSSRLLLSAQSGGQTPDTSGRHGTAAPGEAFSGATATMLTLPREQDHVAAIWELNNLQSGTNAFLKHSRLLSELTVLTVSEAGYKTMFLLRQ